MTRFATFLSGTCRVHGLLVTMVLCVLALGRPARAAQESIVVVPGTGRYISASYISHARTSMLATLQRLGRYVIVDIDRPPEASPRAKESIASIARYYRATAALALDLSRADPQSPAQLTITRIDPSGAPSRDIRVMIDTGPQSLPTIIEGLGPKLAALLDTTATGESPPSREPSPYSMGAKVNLLVPLSAPPGHAKVLGGFGLFLTLDRGSMIVDLGVEFAGGNEKWTNSRGYAYPNQRQYLHGVGVDLLVPWMSTSISPYAGLGMSLVVQRLGGRGAWGIQARPVVGLLVGRHTSVRARFECGYFVDVFTEQELDRLYPGSDRRHRAHGLLFSAGVNL